MLWWASAERRKRPFVGRPVPICSSVTGVTRSMVGPPIRASGQTGLQAKTPASGASKWWVYGGEVSLLPRSATASV